MLVKHCEMKGRRKCGRVAARWVLVEWTGMSNARQQKVYAGCPACIATDGRIVENLGAVEVTVK